MKEIDFSGTVAGRVRWVYNRRYCYYRANMLPFELKTGLRVRRRFRSVLMDLCRLDGAAGNLDEEERSVMKAVFYARSAVDSSSLDSECPSVDDYYRSEKTEVPWTGRNYHELYNYSKALEYGLSECAKSRKITSTVLLGMHSILMDHESGTAPGELRVDQNVIGGHTGLENARFVPADPMSVRPLVENLLKYINTSADEPLMKAALAHYQFEAIHPFMDGNGRMGRLLVALILYTEGVLTIPDLCISEYFTEHRGTYITTLFEVSADDEFDSWFSFFLDALGVQADRSLRLIRKVCSLRDEMLSAETNPRRAAVVKKLFLNPYISVSDVMECTGMTRPGALKLLSQMEEDGIVREITGKQRGKVYLCESIRDVLCG